MMLVFPFLIITLVAFVLLAFFILKFIRGRLSYRTKWKIVISYLVILMISTTIYISVVQPKLVIKNKISEDVPMLSEFIYDDPIRKLPTKYKKHEWEVKVKNQTVHIKIDESSYFTPYELPVIMEEREDTESLAHVEFYETPTILANIDISKYVKLSEVEVNDNEVIVSNNEDFIENYFYSIRNEMTLYQFLDDRSMLDIHYDLQVGEQALYITVPKGTKVEAEEEFFDFFRGKKFH